MTLQGLLAPQKRRYCTGKWWATHAVYLGLTQTAIGEAVSPAGQHEPPLGDLSYRLGLVSTNRVR